MNFSSFANYDYSVSTNKNIELTIQSRNKLKADSLEQKKNVIIIEFNDNNSKVFVNNILVDSRKLDSIPLKGLFLGRNNKNNPDYQSGYLYECGIFNTIISENFRKVLYELLD